MDKSIIPQPEQLPLFPEEERPRGVVIDGVAYISLYDTYRIYGRSSNPTRDWKRDKVQLDKQGYKLPNLVVWQFDAKKGGKPTPVVNEEQIARIAQIALFPEWEPIRQRMVELLIAERHSKKVEIPIRQTKDYRRAIGSGYTDEEAQEWVETDRKAKEIRKGVTSEWSRRGGNIAKLTNLVTKIATGQRATDWKISMNIKESPRQYFSPLKKEAIAIVEWLSTQVHRRNNTQGQPALAAEVADMADVINWDKLAEKFPDRDLELPAPKPKQLRLGQKVGDDV